MTTETSPARKTSAVREPLRPLLARIWRDYLSLHKTVLITSMATIVLPKKLGSVF